MSELLTLLESYGPWALGWPIAFLIWRRNNALTDTVITLVQENNANSATTQNLLTAIKTRLEMKHE